ncbi:MAG: Nif3-like dinuclear metal center hexameric protein [Campylobacterales bacterium]|nr:Nif3-like dinuclear metal center hexameric protein [Campylobacterales bacterium]
MTLGAIYDALDALSPFELQEKWDNSGLIVGDPAQEITTIVLSIDVDEALLEALEEGTLLVTHHPLIFGGLDALNFTQYPAKLLQTMVKKNIANIAMHTNFDQTHLNRWVAEEILGQAEIEQEGFVAYFDVDTDFDAFAAQIQTRFGLPHLKAVKCHERLRRVALVTGSGASLMRGLGADCLLTGDIKYHDAMEAKALGRSMIDIGHFESERFFPEVLAPHLKNFGLTVIISSSKNPFTYY